MEPLDGLALPAGWLLLAVDSPEEDTLPAEAADQSQEAPIAEGEHRRREVDAVLPLEVSLQEVPVLQQQLIR